jgi:hypothetical protein
VKLMPSFCIAAGKRSSGGRSNKMLLLAGYGQPGILGNFRFQLPGIPAGIAEGDDEFRGQAGAADRRQHVARTGQADFAIHRQRRLPLADRAMQHEAAVQLYRATEIDRQFGQIFGFQLEVDLVEQAGQIHVDRAIDDNPQRPVFVVLADIDEGMGEIRVFKRRHGNQEVIGEIYSIHGWNFKGKRH